MPHGPLSGDDEPKVVIRIYCKACGNATAKNAITGREVPYRLRFSRRGLAQLRSELSAMQCVICGGPMAIDEVRE
jgi:hypothetical protein